MDVPLIVDSHGSGLYVRPDGTRCFKELEHPEDRWIRTMAEDAGNDYEVERQLERDRESERDQWAAEDDELPWRRHEKPRGLMFGLADQHRDEEED